ncbi:alpha-1,4-N-acetyl-D-galactosaminyltransferase [Novipirellula artificiosorum]|uniref:Alpha-1,4-N-acetyl-D-galactosaminyltransferase n=2 Tax=Novipirellula artificiosorum TaxID=2528016 RepID=A0A5C6DTW5_9BACT|nr:alpha-1,4-N-acetyl-D-galactosaminyltransferase [Novipirellula artificiosorum]
MARLAARLSKRSHDVVLVTLDDGLHDRHELSASVRKIALDVMVDRPSPLAKLPNLLRRLRAIRRAVCREHPDVVLSFCDRTNIDVLLAMIGSPIPVVISERSDPEHQQLGRFWEGVRRRVYPRSARVVALTSSIAETLSPLHRDRIEVIPSAVDPVASEYRSQREGNVILGVGRLEQEKGFDRLIDAFAIFAQQSGKRLPTPWTLRIVGEGSQRDSLQRLANSLGVANSVEMPGWVRPIEPEYAKASLFVLPSHYEGFPSALLEAMAAGLPCIGMRCQSGAVEIIKHESDGLLCDDNVNALCEAIKRLTDDPERCAQLAAKASEVSDRFGWESMVTRYEAVLRECCVGAR